MLERSFTLAIKQFSYLTSRDWNIFWAEPLCFVNKTLFDISLTVLLENVDSQIINSMNFKIVDIKTFIRLKVS